MSEQQDIQNVKKSAKNFLVVLLFSIIGLGLYIYNSRYYIIIRFNELGPLSKNMAVYYSGFRVGRVARIYPDKDFKHILVKVILNTMNLNLPQNTIVTVERFPSGELYLQFVYPQSPSLNQIRRGDMLEGITPYSLEQFMLSQNMTGMTDVVSEHIIKALNAADAANQEINIFFKTTTKVVQANSEGIGESVNNIVAMTRSFAQMAENLNQVSKKMNGAVDEKTIKDSILNIKSTTDSIANATKNMGQTMQTVDDTISQLNTMAKNLNTMSNGLNTTLSKRFGYMRMMFGKPIKSKGD